MASLTDFGSRARRNAQRRSTGLFDATRQSVGALRRTHAGRPRDELSTQSGAPGFVGPVAPPRPTSLFGATRQSVGALQPNPALVPRAAETAAEPSLTDYESEFRAAQVAAGANVRRQFELALQDIAQREGLANQGLAQLPPQLQAIFAQSGQTLDQGTQALQSAQDASGLQSFLSAQDQLAPLQGAIAADQAARTADVPLLGIAMATEFARQRAGLQQARLGAEGDLAADERDFLRTLALSDRERQQRLEDFERETSIEDRRIREQREHEIGLRGLDAASQVDPDTGLSAAEADAVRLSGGYQLARRDLFNSQNSPEDVYRYVRRNPKLVRVLAADFPAFAQVVAAQIAPTE